MEKIQEALAKARAQREERAATLPAVEKKTTTAPSGSAQGQPAENTDTAANWQALATCVPKPRALQRNRIVGLESGPASTPIDVMRTKILQQMRSNGWKRLAITSPSANCGKSTLITNLGFSLSRQSDLRTVVCDVDFKRPTLSKIFGLKGGQWSFANVLTGKADFAEQAMRPRPNLAFCLTEARVRNSAELLQSPKVGPILKKIEDDYAPDLMLFDMPAMFAADDTIAFMGHVDCVLIVAAAGQSTVREIDVCETELAAQTNILGVVLNKCRYMDKDYNYGGGY